MFTPKFKRCPLKQKGTAKAQYSNIAKTFRGIDGERIDFELRFIKPFQAEEPANKITEALLASEAKVKWGFIGHMDYPMNLIPLFIDLKKC